MLKCQATNQANSAFCLLLTPRLYLWTTTGAIPASLCLKMLRKAHAALLTGHWKIFLLIDIYNQIVKNGGHDKEGDKEEKLCRAYNKHGIAF